MPYAPLKEQFRELALKETRSFSIRENHSTLPADEYGLIELYCDDEDCDCRRVMFDVLSRKRGKSVAVIAYGWESADFYRKWRRRDDPSVVQEMQGLSLNSMSNQSELAPALMEIVRNVILKDSAYVARLKHHYQLFKEKVDPKHFLPSGVPKQPASAKPKPQKRRH